MYVYINVQKNSLKISTYINVYHRKPALQYFLYYAQQRQDKIKEIKSPIK